MCSYQSLFVPVYIRIGCSLQLRCRSLLRRRWPTDTAFRPCWLVFTCLLRYEKSRERRYVQTGGMISRHFSTETLLNTDRQCCESWTDAELGVRSVCADDWRRPLSRSAGLFATLWHWRELSDEPYAHHNQVEFWLLRRLTPAVTDRSPPVLRRQQSVSSVSSTTQLLQCVCCSALAASYIWWHSRFHTMLQTFFPTVPFSIFLGTVLSHNYCSTHVIKVILWFQRCLLIILKFPHRLTAE